jgi:hypothetical protein
MAMILTKRLRKLSSRIHFRADLEIEMLFPVYKLEDYH